MGDRPAARSDGPLRPVIALHGRDHDGVGVMDMGVEAGLAQLARAGYPPFAVVAVDGGNGWWHRRVTGEDSGAMVLNELLPMLATEGTGHVAGRGSSAGRWAATARCCSAARSVRRAPPRSARSPRRCSRTTARRIQEGAFDGPADWFAYSVYGTPALSEIPLRIDCGASDRYYMAIKQFVASLRRPPSGVSFVGGHDVAAWREKLPRELAWLAT